MDSFYQTGDVLYDAMVQDRAARTADLAITAKARKAAPVHYPGTTKFPIRNQADFVKAWALRNSSSVPAAKVEAWLRGVANRFGYKIPGAG